MKVFKISKEGFMCKEIEGDLKSLQEEVGGFITLAPHFDELTDMGIDIYADDEGLLKADPKISMVVFGDNHEKVESVLVGDLILVGHDEEGNTKGLTSEQLVFIYNHLAKVSFSVRGSDEEIEAFTFIFEEEKSNEM